LITQEIISNSIPPILANDTVDKALNWMSEFHTNHLVYIHNNELIGILSEEELLEVHDDTSLIKDLKSTLIKPFVFNNDHLFNALNLFNLHQLDLLPVLDLEKKYVGIITLQNIVKYFAEIYSVQNPGGILTLEMDNRDYSLTEISKIVESCEASILNSIVKSANSNRNIEVTLKINKTELGDVISTFERFGYTIKYTFQESIYSDLLKERFESFMNYLDI